MQAKVDFLDRADEGEEAAVDMISIRASTHVGTASCARSHREGRLTTALLYLRDVWQLVKVGIRESAHSS
jgi:hypothetical protein